MTDFERFIKVNKLKKKDIAEYLGVSAAFVTQLAQGVRDIPEDKFALIKANGAWDTCMLYGEGDMLKSQQNNTPTETRGDIVMSREVFEQISRLTETVLSQQRTIELLTSKKIGTADNARTVNAG